MAKRSLFWYIKQLHRPVFTTHELCISSQKSSSTVTQALNVLEKEGIIFKIYRGIWAERGHEKLSPYAVIPHLFPRQRAYVSFISALHLCGVIEQIPQVITLASLVHTKTVHTTIGTFSIHRIHPRFFDGFNWYKKEGTFLIAEPEKALVDSLYLSTRRKKQFGHFPELHFSRAFSFKKTKEWVKRIPEYKIRTCVQKRLDMLLEAYKKCR
jgi:predicted transcriptional regulator of viral defense system